MATVNPLELLKASVRSIGTWGEGELERFIADIEKSAKEARNQGNVEPILSQLEAWISTSVTRADPEYGEALRRNVPTSSLDQPTLAAVIRAAKGGHPDRLPPVTPQPVPLD